MAKYAYLVPTADASLNHSCSSGSSGWAMIDEITADDGSTYIYHTISTSNSSKTSSFTLTGSIPTYPKATVTAAQLIVRAQRTSSSIIGSTTAAATISYEGGSSNSITISAGSWSTTTINLDASQFSCGNTYSKKVSITSSGSTNKNSTDLRITQCIVKITYDATYNVSVEHRGYEGTESVPSTVTLGNSTSLKVTILDKPILKAYMNGTDITSDLTDSSDTDDDGNITATYKNYTYSDTTNDIEFYIYYEIPYYKKNDSWNMGKKLYVKNNGVWEEQIIYDSIWSNENKYQFKFID